MGLAVVWSNVLVQVSGEEWGTAASMEEAAKAGTCPVCQVSRSHWKSHWINCRIPFSPLANWIATTSFAANASMLGCKGLDFLTYNVKTLQSKNSFREYVFVNCSSTSFLDQGAKLSPLSRHCQWRFGVGQGQDQLFNQFLLIQKDEKATPSSIRCIWSSWNLLYWRY